jgi:hypothetical protein
MELCTRLIKRDVTRDVTRDATLPFSKDLEMPAGRRRIWLTLVQMDYQRRRS